MAQVFARRWDLYPIRIKADICVYLFPPTCNLLVSEIKCVSGLSLVNSYILTVHSPAQQKKEYFWKVLKINLVLTIAGDSDFS
jgi:hypothetical protein